MPTIWRGVGDRLFRLCELPTSDGVETVVDAVGTAVFSPFGPTPQVDEPGEISPLQVDGDGALYVKVQGTVTTAGGSGDSRPLGFFYGEPVPALEAVGPDTEKQLAMTAYLASHVSLRKATGEEVGTATDPLRINPTGTTAQPVTDNGGSLTIDGAVSLTGSLPAGTANIGDVDVLTLPSLPGGTNNIGDVDVLTLPGGLRGYAEDVPHASGDIGTLPLAVFKPFGPETLVDNPDDYHPLQVDGDGALYVRYTNTIAAADGIARLYGFHYGEPVPGGAAAVIDGEAPLAMTEYLGLHVSLRRPTGAEVGTAAEPLRINPTGTTAQPVTDNGGSLTVDGTLAISNFPATQPVSGTVAATQSTSPWVVGDGGGSLTVDGAVSLAAALPAGTNNIGDVDVLTLPAGTVAGSSSLPAGTNNIGDVDVLTLPAGTVAGAASLPAGSNNIGDVDVLTLPSLPAGSNNIGDVDVLTLPSGTVAGGSSLPAGTNNIGDVDVLSIAAGDNTIGRVKITDGTLLATVRDTGATDSLNVAITDASGNQITSFGGGTEYTEGNTDSTITGTAILWEDTSDTLRAVSAAKPLPVSDAGGSLTVDGTVTADTELPAAVALSDALANPTTPMVGSSGLVWDPGTTSWQRSLSANGADGQSGHGLLAAGLFAQNFQGNNFRPVGTVEGIRDSSTYVERLLAVGQLIRNGGDATGREVYNGNSADNTAGLNIPASGGMTYSSGDTKWFRWAGNSRGEGRVVEYTPVVVSGTLTRPANVTTYTINDELTDTGGAILAIAGCARYNGGSGYIEAITVIGSVNAATDPLLDIFVFDTTSTPAADNAAFAPTDAVMNTCIVARSLGTAFAGDVAAGGNLLWQLSGLRIPFTCGASSTSLFVRFAVRNGYVPPSNSEIFVVRLHCFQS